MLGELWVHFNSTDSSSVLLVFCMSPDVKALILNLCVITLVKLNTSNSFEEMYVGCIGETFLTLTSLRVHKSLSDRFQFPNGRHKNSIAS